MSFLFHASAMEGITFEEVREGQRVAFETGENRRKSGCARAEVVRLSND